MRDNTRYVAPTMVAPGTRPRGLPEGAFPCEIIDPPPALRLHGDLSLPVSAVDEGIGGVDRDLENPGAGKCQSVHSDWTLAPTNAAT
jgi:hypothetical protein